MIFAAICMISRSLILLILQGVKIMRVSFYEAPAEIMQIDTTGGAVGLAKIRVGFYAVRFKI